VNDVAIRIRMRPFYTSPTAGKPAANLPQQKLIKLNPVHAASAANKRAKELKLNDNEIERITDIFIRCATILGNSKSLQVIIVDEDPSHVTPIEEILEIFVRANSGGLVLQKSDLLMSLLDLKWNDIQPELQTLVRDINECRPFLFTRDDVLKSLLLAEGAETRFDKLVNDRRQVELLASRLPSYIPAARKAWERLGCILTDNCRIYSERFFRGGHNALLPFVLFLSKRDSVTPEDRRKIVIGIYLSIMSGVFSGAEARMGAFTKNKIANAQSFPLDALVAAIKREYGIKSLDDILRRHLDLALNIAHGGITLDKNPDQLQRDHIFPKSRLEKAGYPYEMVNHYANFHFLRGSDNLNKLDKEPHEWFRSPGKNIPPYSDQDLEERLLEWDDLNPGQFVSMIEKRSGRIRAKAAELFGMKEEELNVLFTDSTPSGTEMEVSVEGNGEGVKALAQAKYVQFYTQCIESLKMLVPREYTLPSSRSYYQIPTGIGRVHFEWWFHGRSRSSFGVELHCERGSKEQNQATIVACSQLKERLEAELGEAVVIQMNWGKTWARLYIQKADGTLTDTLREWAVKKMAKLIEILQPELDKINTRTG
jgi:hypothetical protein